MTLVSVLLALALDRILLWHRDTELARVWQVLVATTARYMPPGWQGMGAVLLLVLPGTALIGLLQWAIGGWLFGLVGLLLAVIVLLFALGPLDVANSVDDYVEARRQGDGERSDYYYARLAGEQRPEGRDEEDERFARAVFCQANDHLFAALFWFCVLGPVGAALYRLVAEVALRPPEAVAARPPLTRAARDAIGILGWIPTRLLAIAYALVGNFEAAFRRLRSGSPPVADWLSANHALLSATGVAALRASEEPEGASPATASSDSAAADEPNAARWLVVRAVILWLAVLALLTLAGWFG